LAAGHAYFLYDAYLQMVGKPDATNGTVNPYVPFGLAGLYLLLVPLGMKVMAGREAFDLKQAMHVYNLYTAGLSAVMAVVIFKESVLKGPIWAVHVDRSARGSLLAYMLWVNYQSKFLEYFDTLFMILRKKFNQVTTLHVAHHAEMGPIMWLIVRLAPGGTSVFGPMLNSAIHAVMYSYYFITAMGVKVSWKKQLTIAQLLQFVAVMGHALFNAYHWGVYWPGTLIVVEGLLMVQMLFMFGDFFQKAYSSGSAAGKKPATNSHSNGHKDA